MKSNNYIFICPLIFLDRTGIFIREDTAWIMDLHKSEPIIAADLVLI